MAAKNRGVPIRAKNGKDRAIRYFGNHNQETLTLRLLRRVLKSNGPVYARQLAENNLTVIELRKLAKQNTKIGRLASLALDMRVMNPVKTAVVSRQ